MANQPIQLPNIDLPGAEYFSLAPNSTVALGGRRRFMFQGAVTAAPANTNNIVENVSQVLETNFTPTSGIFLHAFYAIAAQNLGPGLTINNVFVGLSLRTTPNPDYPLGSPTLTSPELSINTVVLSDRDRLIASKDILVVPNLGIPVGNTLTLAGQISVNNPTAGALNFNLALGIIYTRLDGLTE